MNLVLTREEVSLKSTAGRLFIDGGFFCYTLEDTLREIVGIPVEKWKIKKETAIPAGIYKVTLAPSPKRGGRIMPLLLNVPGFVGIQIHVGNNNVDTEGCILVGDFRESVDYIRGSIDAFTKLFKQLLKAHDKGEEVYITVHNPLGWTGNEKINS